MAWYIKGFVDRGRMLMRSHIDVYNIDYIEICKSNSTIVAWELVHVCNKKTIMRRLYLRVPSRQQ